MARRRRKHGQHDLVERTNNNALAAGLAPHKRGAGGAGGRPQSLLACSGVLLGPDICTSGGNFVLSTKPCGDCCKFMRLDAAWKRQSQFRRRLCAVVLVSEPCMDSMGNRRTWHHGRPSEGLVQLAPEGARKPNSRRQRGSRSRPTALRGRSSAAPPGRTSTPRSDLWQRASTCSPSASRLAPPLLHLRRPG